jgi:hypothetical protein
MEKDTNVTDIGAGASQKGLTRREALKRGLAIGAVAWAVPVVQAVGIRPAYAKAPSGGCVRYCLKWEPDGPSGDSCPPPVDGLPPPDALLGWAGTWSALGGQPARRNAAPTDTLGEESSTTTEPTTVGDAGLGDLSTQPTGLDDTVSGTTSTTAGTDPSDGLSGLGSGLDDTSDTPGKSGDAPGKAGSSDETTTTTTDVTSEQTPLAEPDQAPPRDVPPSTPPGNCLDCPEEEFALNTLPRGVNLNKQVAVYGSPTGGFRVTYPKSWHPADLDSGSPISAKCGSARSSGPGEASCNLLYVELDDPCGDSSRAAFQVMPCSNGHAISHIELILDICQ